jgi:hypothetical protein
MTGAGASDSRPRRLYQALMWLWVIAMLGLYLQSFAEPIGLIMNSLLKFFK